MRDLVNDVIICHHFTRGIIGTNFDFIPCQEVKKLDGSAPHCLHTVLEKTYTHEGIWMLKAFIQNLVTFILCLRVYSCCCFERVLNSYRQSSLPYWVKNCGIEELFLTENNWFSDTFSIWRWYYVIPCFCNLCTPFSIKPCHRQNGLNSLKYSIFGYKSFLFVYSLCTLSMWVLMWLEYLFNISKRICKWYLLKPSSRSPQIWQ